MSLTAIFIWPIDVASSQPPVAPIAQYRPAMCPDPRNCMRYIHISIVCMYCIISKYLSIQR